MSAEIGIERTFANTLYLSKRNVKHPAKGFAVEKLFQIKFQKEAAIDF